MHQLLKRFEGKLIKIFTISGGESYVGTLKEVGDEYVLVLDQNKGEEDYIAIGKIEAIKPLPEDHPGER